MKEFFKANGIWLIIVAVLLGFTIYQQFELKEKYSLLDYKDSLIKIDSMRYSKLALEFEDQKRIDEYLQKTNKSLSDLLDKAKEEVRVVSGLLLKLKTQHFTGKDTVHVFNVIHDTIQVPIGQDTVGFDAENSLFKVTGQTSLYPYKSYWLNFEGKPFSIDFVISEDRNGIFKTYIDTKNPDLELIDVNTRFIKEKNTLGFWGNLTGVGDICFTNKDVTTGLGILYKKIGIKGIIGYDYQDYTIAKNNLKYGGGIVFKLFN